MGLRVWQTEGRVFLAGEAFSRSNSLVIILSTFFYILCLSVTFMHVLCLSAHFMLIRPTTKIAHLMRITKSVCCFMLISAFNAYQSDNTACLMLIIVEKT